MAQQLTAADARLSLNAHVAAKGAEIFAKYGPRIGWRELQAILLDRTCVRYPCTIEFDASPLRLSGDASLIDRLEKVTDARIQSGVFKVNVPPRTACILTAK